MLKHYCMNCRRETEFDTGVCPHCNGENTCCTCGRPMRDSDDYGNETHFCPNYCRDDIISEELSFKRQYTSRCWKCRKEIDSKVCQPDKVREFAYICSNPLCDVSLREHPNVKWYVAEFRKVPMENITDEILKYLFSIPKR